MIYWGKHYLCYLKYSARRVNAQHVFSLVTTVLKEAFRHVKQKQWNLKCASRINVDKIPGFIVCPPSLSHPYTWLHNILPLVFFLNVPGIGLVAQ